MPLWRWPKQILSPGTIINCCPKQGPDIRSSKENYSWPQLPTASTRTFREISSLSCSNTWKRHPIGKVYHAPFDVYLNDVNVYQPDILFVSDKRRGILTDAGAEGGPDFVVEILSPRTAQLDTDLKPKIYKATGVEELWIVDPKAKTIAAYYLQRQDQTAPAIFGQRDEFTSPCFPGLTFRAVEIFKQ